MYKNIYGGAANTDLDDLKQLNKDIEQELLNLGIKSVGLEWNDGSPAPQLDHPPQSIPFPNDITPFVEDSEMQDKLESLKSLSERVDKKEQIKIIKELVDDEIQVFKNLSDNEKEDMLADKIAKMLQKNTEIVNEEVYNCLLERIFKWVFSTLGFSESMSDYISSATAVITRYLYYGAWAIFRTTFWYVLKHWDRMLILGIEWIVYQYLQQADYRVRKAQKGLERKDQDEQFYKDLLGEFGGDMTKFLQRLYTTFGGMTFKGLGPIDDALSWATSIWYYKVIFYTAGIFSAEFGFELLYALSQIDPYCNPEYKQKVVVKLNNNNKLKSSLLNSIPMS